MKKTLKNVLSALFLSAFLAASACVLSSCDLSAVVPTPVFITGTQLNEDGELIITYSDGSNINLGAIINKDEKRSITETKINDNGELIITYSDGTTENLGVVVGKDGKDTTVRVTHAEINASGELILYYSDETEQNLGKVVGKDGIDTSVRVTHAEINASGELILYYSDETEQNLGKVVGKDGVDAAEPPTVIEVTVAGDAESATAAVSAAAPSVVSIVTEFKSVLQSTASAGSGVILSIDKAAGDALIVTNYHVLYEDGKLADDIHVFLYGSPLPSQSISATLVGGSLKEDVALLKIVGSDRLKNSIAKAATLADSDALHPGDTAIAIGNPRGKGISATYGKVNVPTESLETTASDKLTPVTLRVIRIDTAVNGGNSGGGLFNSQGELIGIVNAKIIEENVENIGFALPINKVKSLVDNIIYYCLDDENVTPYKPTFGITIKIVDSVAVVNEQTGLLDIKETIDVAEVSIGTPANGVFMAGDRLVSVRIGERTVEITKMHHLTDAALDLRPGDTMYVKVLRSGVEMELAITPPDASYKPC